MSDLRAQAHRALTRGRRTSHVSTSTPAAASADIGQSRPTLCDIDGHPITLPAEPAVFGGSREDNQP